MRKTGIAILILSFTLSLGFAQEKRFQLSLFGGASHVFAYGSEDDYIFGENDFPVTPSHTPLNFGLSFTLFLTDLFGIEIDGLRIANCGPDGHGVDGRNPISVICFPIFFLIILMAAG